MLRTEAARLIRHALYCVIITALAIPVSACNKTGDEEPTSAGPTPVPVTPTPPAAPLEPPAGISELEYRFFISALFFGTGPDAGFQTSSTSEIEHDFVEGERALGYEPGRTMIGWVQGASIRVLISSALTAHQHEGVLQALDEVRAVTEGANLQISVDATGAAVVPPNEGELVVFPSRADVSRLCGAQAVGCAQFQLTGDGGIERASVFLFPDVSNVVITHEIGHAVLGLHHVKAPDGMPAPVMLAVGRNADRLLTQLEHESVRQVYRRGLRAGAHRGDFMAKNVILR